MNPDDLRKRMLYPAMDAAGINRTARAYGFHLFRHSAGTEFENLTGNLKKTSSFLGHASTAITGDVYCHITPDAEQSDIERLESKLFPGGISAVLLSDVIKTAA